MTIQPDVDYPLPKPAPTAPLVNPSHAKLHTDTATAIQSLDDRLEVLEGLAPTTALNIEQARMVANTWTVHGVLAPDQTHLILIPLIWNITGRTVIFNGAKATVLTPADEEIRVDLVVGTTLTGPQHDHSGGTQTSILKTPLVIPAGSYYSATIGKDDFVGAHPMNTYLAAFIEECGSVDAPGGDLTIQLNRSL